MTGPMPDIEAVWKALAEVSDPEIPVLSIVAMKIISNVAVEGSSVSVEITPTFTGCPALEHIKEQVRGKLVGLGFERIDVYTSFRTPWSTDLLDDETRSTLRTFGIAPPAKVEWDLSTSLSQPVACPYCNSMNTHMESPFGPTLCKQIYYCDGCRQSFERFKTI